MIGGQEAAEAAACVPLASHARLSLRFLSWRPGLCPPPRAPRTSLLTAASRAASAASTRTAPPAHSRRGRPPAPSPPSGCGGWGGGGGGARAASEEGAAPPGDCSGSGPVMRAARLKTQPCRRRAQRYRSLAPMRAVATRPRHGLTTPQAQAG
jgi:hypothetical protein